MYIRTGVFVVLLARLLDKKERFRKLTSAIRECCRIKEQVPRQVPLKWLRCNTLMADPLNDPTATTVCVEIYKVAS